MPQIKFVDLAAQNAEIKADVERNLARVHEKTAYVGGPAVAAFEEQFAEFLGARRVVGVGSGTDALRLALMALDIGEGDEVITTPMTFIATAEAIVQAGARPVFVDIDPITRNISVPAIRRYLEAGRFSAANGPKAIMPVHLYGLPGAMDSMRALADEYGLKIVEDACQAHGARVRVGGEWMRAGAVGAAGCFSFYPGKNLGAWGEAGAVATNDGALADRIALLRDHGRISHYAHRECGYNARLDAVQAAVLSAKLQRLEQWNARRREIAESYRKLLARTGVILPTEPEDAQSCYHLFVVQSARRDALREALIDNQIECGIHYPLPLHLQPACGALGYRRGDFGDSERVADTALSLPMHPHLRDAEVARVAEVVAGALKGGQSLFAGERYAHGAACIPPPRGE
jgi:dTDP-4-amino-4,6-dideoxygalactose transaminase